MIARPPYQDNVTTLPVARVIPEDGGGRLVITPRGHAWVHGDRGSAIRDKTWLDSNLRGRA
jgi:hypothetical protein